MQQNLTEWDEDVVSTPEEEYQTFLRGLSWGEGFGIEFVRCSPASGQDLIEKIRQDLPQKNIEVLTLSEPIDNLIKIVQSMPNHSELDILFVVGLDKSLTDYIRTGYGGQGEYYNLDTVPPILSHLNWQRENFRDRFPNLCFVFLLPQFAIKYIIRRAPDFYDWASGKTDIPSSQELLTQESQRIIGQDFDEYLEWTPQQHKERILEINELLLEPNQSQDQQASLLFERGNIFVATNQYEEAIDAYDHALSIKSDYHEACNSRGNALVNLEKHEEAIRAYDRALAINSDYNEAWQNRGIALANLGRNEKAIISYDRALTIKPDDDKVLYNRGNALFNLGRYEEAIISYDKALDIKPNNHQIWNNRGNALFNLGRYKEAIESYDKALAIKPDDYKILCDRSNTLFNLGRYEEAIESYDKALAIKPDDYKILCKQGVLLRNLGRYEEAIKSYDKALAIKPDDQETWYNRVITLGISGRYEEASKAYNQFKEMKTNDNYYLNRLQFILGTSEEELATYSKEEFFWRLTMLREFRERDYILRQRVRRRT